MGSPRREAEKVLGMPNREAEIERQWAWISVGMGCSVHDACQDTAEIGPRYPKAGPAVSQEILSSVDRMAVSWGRSSVTCPLLSQSYLYHGRSEGQYGPIAGLNLCSSLAVVGVGTT